MAFLASKSCNGENDILSLHGGLNLNIQRQLEVNFKQLITGKRLPSFFGSADRRRIYVANEYSTFARFILVIVLQELWITGTLNSTQNQSVLMKKHANFKLKHTIS